MRYRCLITILTWSKIYNFLIFLEVSFLSKIVVHVKSSFSSCFFYITSVSSFHIVWIGMALSSFFAIKFPVNYFSPAATRKESSLFFNYSESLSISDFASRCFVCPLMHAFSKEMVWFFFHPPKGPEHKFHSYSCGNSKCNSDVLRSLSLLFLDKTRSFQWNILTNLQTTQTFRGLSGIL
jgi:hypothetical protein